MIDYTYRDLFHRDSIDKQWIITDGEEITITNSDIYEDSIKIEETLCGRNNHIVFGSCDSSTISFTTFNLAKLKGKKITVSLVLDGNDDEPFVVGSYTVVSDDLTADMEKREIMAYDDLNIINTTNVAEWYDGLTFPLTLKQFRDSFFNYFNITQETTTLVNDNMTIEKTVEAEVLSGATVIQSICELNGRCGHINREGVFVYLPIYKGSTALYPSLTLYPHNRLFPSIDKEGARSIDVPSSEYSKVEFADYDVKHISKLQIRQEEADIGAISGTGDNAYVVEDNFLVYGKSAADLKTVADNLLPEIDDTTYVPLKVNCINADLCVEVGDVVQVQTSDGRYLDSFVMSRYISGLQALKDEIESQGDEYQTEEVNSLNTEVIQLKGKTTTIEKNVEGVRVEVSDLARDTSASLTILDNKIATKVATSDFNSTVTQLSNQISTKVTHGNISSEISQEAGQISISANRIAITSDKFTLDNDGKVTCSDMNISGGSLSITKGNNLVTITADKGLNVVDTNYYLTRRSWLTPTVLHVGLYSEDVPTSSHQYMKYDSLGGTGKGVLRLVASDFIDSGGNVEIGILNHSAGHTYLYHDTITLNYNSSGTTEIKGKLTCDEDVTLKGKLSLTSTSATITTTYGNITTTYGTITAKNLSISGTKNRVVATKSYNTRALNAYETADCYFGDIGEGQLDENGICNIELDPIFLETVNTKIPYQVFLQAYGDGKCWVSERNENNFVVKGTPNMPFGYEIKAKQLGYENNRLEEVELPKTEEVNEDGNKLQSDTME